MQVNSTPTGRIGDMELSAPLAVPQYINAGAIPRRSNDKLQR